MPLNKLDKYKEKVASLSQKTFKGFAGYDIGKMMADNIELYDQFGIGRFACFKMFIPFLIDQEDFSDIALAENCILAYLSLNYANRQDFKNVYYKLQNIIHNICIITENRKFSVNKYGFRDLQNIFSWYVEIRKAGIPSKCAFFLIKRMEVCYKIKRIFERKSLANRVNAFVSQYDAHDTDNVISQHMRMNSVPTVTLQHGHFHSAEFVSDSNFNLASQHFGLVSDYFFVWGEYSKREALKDGIPEKKIKCVGSLKHSVERKTNSHKRSNMFAVMLNGRYGLDENKVIIDYAEKVSNKFGYKYILRAHPGIKINKKEFDVLSGCAGLSGQEESVTQLARKCDFVICGNSTVVTEMIAINKAVFFMKPINTIDWYDCFHNLKFTNYKELEEWISILNLDKSKIDNIILQYKKFLFATDNTFEAYRLAIEEILTERK